MSEGSRSRRRSRRLALPLPPWGANTRCCGNLRQVDSPFLLFLRLLGDPELPTGVEHRQPFASFKLDRPQMLKDLFGCVPFFGHVADLPRGGPA